MHTPFDEIETRASDDELPLGARFGPWVTTRELGRGGTAVVFEARHAELGHTVALKHLRAADDAVARRRFLREARVLATLRHPHLVPVYDAGVAKAGPWLTMERLDGESLAARVARGPLPVEAAVGVALGVLSALARVHAEAVVHRDVKPANVFLTAGDAMAGVRLLDFGAVHCAPREGDSIVTREGSSIGTPAYMSPEQIVGGAVDARADLFSLSATLYECLTGARAFAGSSLPATIAAIMAGPPAALRSHTPSVPRALDRLVRNGLSRDPATREPSALHLGDALCDWASAPDRARWRELTHAMPRDRRPARAYAPRVAVAVVAATLLVALRLASTTATPAPRTTTHALLTPQRAERAPPPATRVAPVIAASPIAPSPAPAPAVQRAARPAATTARPRRTITTERPAAAARVLGRGTHGAWILAPSQRTETTP